MWHRFIIWLSNALAHLRRRVVAPENLLVLAPHCLQRRDCRYEITESIGNCRQCGRCRIADLVQLQSEYQVKVCVANGGRRAVEMLRDRSIKAVVAIACEKELAAGILSAASKRIFAIPNTRPFGSCCDTDVGVEEIRRAVRKALTSTPQRA